MSDVKVEQIDRDAAASIAVLVEMRELIRAGKADHHAEPFARHRIAARAALVAEIVADMREKAILHRSKWGITVDPRAEELADMIKAKWGKL